MGVPLRVGLSVASPRYAVGFPLQSLTWVKGISLSCVDTLAHGDMGGSPDTSAKNSVMIDFFILFIGYVADYSKFHIFRPFQRIDWTKPGVSHLVPPGQQYPYAVRRISLDPCTFDKFPAAVLDFIKGGMVQ